jgi:hypothetical protein
MTEPESSITVDTNTEKIPSVDENSSRRVNAPVNSPIENHSPVTNNDNPNSKSPFKEMRAKEEDAGPIGAHAGGHSFVVLGKKENEASFYTADFPIKNLNPKKTPNYIRTTKYTLLTFLPLNLYFQV